MANLDPKTPAGFRNLPYSPKIVLAPGSLKYGEEGQIWITIESVNAHILLFFGRCRRDATRSWIWCIHDGLRFHQSCSFFCQLRPQVSITAMLRSTLYQSVVFLEKKYILKLPLIFRSLRPLTFKEHLHCLRRYKNRLNVARAAVMSIVSIKKKFAICILFCCCFITIAMLL